MNYFRLLWHLCLQKRNVKKSGKQIERLRQKKLGKLLRYAYSHSAYYRKTFEAAGISADTLMKTPLYQFPVLNKDLLMEHFDELVTDSSLKQDDLRTFDEQSEDGTENYLGKYHVVHSSGSTGIPRYFVYDHAAWEQMLLGIIRGALWGMSMWSVLKLLAGKPRILYIAAADGRYGGAMAVGDGIRGLHAEQKFLDINTPLASWSKTVGDFQPDIVIGYPSAIKILAELMQAERMSLKIERLISCGEPLSPCLRKFLETAFRTTVINFYGASESLALGVEENSSEGMILFDDLNIVEVIDGKMYVTCLYNFTQPLIRYHISDQLVMHNAEEGMECQFSRAEVLLSRNEDVLWFETADGRREYLHPLSIEGFCIEGMLDYQFCQTSKRSFEVRVEIMDSSVGSFVSEEMERQMDQVLRENGLEEVQFTIRFVEQIMPDTHTGKKLLVIKNREDNDYEEKYYRKAI